MCVKYRSEEPIYKNVADSIVALDAIIYKALVVPLYLGIPKSAILYLPPLIAKDIPTIDSPIANLIPLRAVE